VFQTRITVPLSETLAIILPSLEKAKQPIKKNKITAIITNLFFCHGHEEFDNERE
jgi:hypothetical protein